MHGPMNVKRPGSKGSGNYIDEIRNLQIMTKGCDAWS